MFFGLGAYCAARALAHGIAEPVRRRARRMVVERGCSRSIVGLPGAAPARPLLRDRDARDRARGRRHRREPRRAGRVERDPACSKSTRRTSRSTTTRCGSSRSARCWRRSSIARSKLGYAFVAIRENEDAAAVLGICRDALQDHRLGDQRDDGRRRRRGLRAGQRLHRSVDHVRGRLERVPDRR